MTNNATSPTATRAQDVPAIVQLEHLRDHLIVALEAKAQRIAIDQGELKVLAHLDDYLAVATLLRDDPQCRFEQLIDLCALDYLTYQDAPHEGPRFCVVSQLLSVSRNQRVRLKVFAADNDVPVVPSLTALWSSANWFEREAFDLLGVMFEGHSDLRRILTDYGFIGHPLRKDFPVCGHVEMTYDETQQRVVYQPITIEPREQVPRIIREPGYGGIAR